ncbi:SDR family oxidoreductase [Aliibacillus thermotolerans]|uniref:SDR family oxidoreductase n=1 Tax=Aliibacillus thermotolerans TaxID=1834418 RepID=A0ABW0U4A1_9BACI|nr:SDR family oxidoreductase [Aliibacillus thermotolerans]MDA3129245.1 NAD(P)H-binding protein [Aliibacillus thermotolerans]
MNVLLIGANGKIAREFVKKASQEKKEIQVKAMIRKEEQKEDLLQLGASEVVIADLEKDIHHAFTEVDAVIFAAGSGGHTGGDKTLLVDLWGAMKSVDAAKKHGIHRFCMISSMRAKTPEKGPESIRHYLVAKMVADDYLRDSGLDYTIIRPGILTNDAPTGHVHIQETIEETGEITRADVAHVLLSVLDNPNTYRKSFDVIGGDIPIEKAVAQI